MNDLTRFSVVFFGVKKSDFKTIDKWLISAIFNAMRVAGFTEKEITKYLDGAPETITYNRSKNRTLVARLNKAIEVADIACQEDGVYEDVLEQRHITKFCNEFLVCENNYKNCYHPKDKLKEYIELLN